MFISSLITIWAVAHIGGIAVSNSSDLTATINHASGPLATDGAIDLNINTGVPPFEFAWDGPDGFSSTEEDLTDLSPGTYFVTVTDAIAQEAILGVEVSYQCPCLILGIRKKYPCVDSINGRLELILTNEGVEPYSISWGHGAQDPVIDHLSPGTYSVSVSDQVGCEHHQIVELPSNSAISIDKNVITQPPYSTIQVYTNGGQPPYSYNWLDGPITPDRTSLLPGVYVLTIKDFYECTLIDTTIISPIVAAPSKGQFLRTNKANRRAIFTNSDHTIRLQFHSSKAGNAQLYLSNLMETTLYKNTIAVGVGANEALIRLDTGDKSMIYWLHLILPDGERIQQKIWKSS